ncbi:hypothetical protein ACKKBG_A14325 [Auxenochlorella protothecoides x Auxenochlorella symbiontica]
MASKEGNQIFITVRRGKQYPPKTIDVRIKYEQTIRDLREAAAASFGLSLDLLQLFWRGRELTSATDGLTLLEANLHTGFSLQGYDLSEAPDYWPAVVQTPEGLAFETVAAAAS